MDKKAMAEKVTMDRPGEVLVRVTRELHRQMESDESAGTRHPTQPIADSVRRVLGITIDYGRDECGIEIRAELKTGEIWKIVC